MRIVSVSEKLGWIDRDLLSEVEETSSVRMTGLMSNMAHSDALDPLLSRGPNKVSLSDSVACCANVMCHHP